MNSSTKVGLILTPLGLLALIYAVFVACYFLTDSAYERLTATRPSTRADVLRALPSFKEVRVTDPERMQPLLRDNLEAGEASVYFRYTKYLGFPIDVVYDDEGNIHGLWPEYE